MIPRLWIYAVVILLLQTSGSPPVYSQVLNENDRALTAIDVEEHLGRQLPLELTFTDENGKPVKLGDFFDGERPVIMALAYYECPMLCTLVLNGIADGVKNLDHLKSGEDYQLLTVSIDPAETAELAKDKQKTYLAATGDKATPADWTFCVGAEDNIRTLADSLGFDYYYDAELDNFAHPAVIYLITPEGRISRYLYGIHYKAQDLRLGLLEASRGKIGTTVDRVLLYCYHYDPDTKGYVVFAGNVMRLGGVVTLGLLGIFLLLLWRRDHQRKKEFRKQTKPVNE